MHSRRCTTPIFLLSVGAGFGLAGAALYSSVATEIEDERGPKLPIGRRGRARSALEEPLSAQLARIEHEAGVREQL